MLPFRASASCASKTSFVCTRLAPKSEDEQALPYDMIVVHPFTATSDSTVLGIRPIPNLQQRIDKMLQKYRSETIDIEDIDYEEPDLEESVYFPKIEH